LPNTWEELLKGCWKNDEDDGALFRGAIGHCEIGVEAGVEVEAEIGMEGEGHENVPPPPPLLPVGDSDRGTGKALPIAPPPENKGDEGNAKELLVLEVKDVGGKLKAGAGGAYDEVEAVANA
jgi:hypothetical protein